MANLTAEQQAFPVITPERWGDGCPRFVRWEALSEKWAQINHGQTLTRLAERGGLDPTELVANLGGFPWRDMDLERAVGVIRHYEVKPVPAPDCLSCEDTGYAMDQEGNQRPCRAPGCKSRPQL